MSPPTNTQPDTATSKRGGTEAAIRHHYDLSNTFYALWLDETMTYSCALWHDDEGPEQLAAAQYRKLDFHLDAAGAARARRLLDIGCGWGSLMARALDHTPVEHTTGLTLSDAQHQHILARGDTRIELRKESWIDHVPAELYDSIVSVGALEHFASPGDNRRQKIGLYQEFFRKCRSWLRPGGALSLQTIAYGTMGTDENSAFIREHIFPDAELPQPHELVEAASGTFELIALRNDRLHYARTCDVWYRNLRRRRTEAVAIVGEDKVRQYEAYLRMSAFGFNTGRVGLLRLAFIPVV